MKMNEPAVERVSKIDGIKFTLEMRPFRWGWVVFLNKDKHVGESFRLYGEYSPVQTDLLMALVEEGDVVIDAGANMGGFTIPFAKRVGPLTGRVIAFEPQFVINRVLNMNVVLNNVGDVVDTHRACLGDKEGKITIPLYNYDVGENFGGLGFEQWEKVTSGVETPVVTLDSLDLRTVDFIKGDIEGAELKMLKGGKELIARCRPVMMLENNHEDTFKGLIEYLVELNYELRWVITPLYSPENFYQNTTNIYGTASSFDLLCVPRERTKKLRLGWEGFPKVSVNDRRGSAPGEWIITGVWSGE